MRVRSLAVPLLAGLLAAGCGVVDSVVGSAPQGALEDQRVLFEGAVGGHTWQLVEGQSEDGPALQTWRNGRPESTSFGFALGDDKGLRYVNAQAPLVGDDPEAAHVGILLGSVLVGQDVDRVVVVQNGVAVSSGAPVKAQLLGMRIAPIAVAGLQQHVWIVACDGEVEVGAQVAWVPEAAGGESGLDDAFQYCETEA